MSFFYIHNGLIFILSKSIDSITLRDFKECIKLKPGTYRFHFKSQDPEFGIVKEEASFI
jgi:hypothetical protein